MARLTGMTGHSLSMRLLEQYLARPYGYFLTNNTSELGKNLLTEVSEVVNGVLQPCMQLVARGVLSVFIVVFLAVVSPWLALGVLVVLCGCYFLIYWGVRQLLMRSGIKRMSSNSMRFKIATEIFSTIKDVKLMNLERPFSTPIRAALCYLCA